MKELGVSVDKEAYYKPGTLGAVMHLGAGKSPCHLYPSCLPPVLTGGGLKPNVISSFCLFSW